MNMEPGETDRRTRLAYEALSPEGKAQVDAHRKRRYEQEGLEAEVRDREIILEELRTTGTVAPNKDGAWPRDEARLVAFVRDLRRRREEAGMTLAEVAERTGIDQPALSRLENGKGNPTARTLSRYCRALGGRVAWAFEPSEDQA